VLLIISEEKKKCSYIIDLEAREGGFCYGVMWDSRKHTQGNQANQDFQPISLNSGHVPLILSNKPVPAVQGHPEKRFKELCALWLPPAAFPLALVGLYKHQESRLMYHAVVLGA